MPDVVLVPHPAASRFPTQITRLHRDVTTLLASSPMSLPFNSGRTRALTSECRRLCDSDDDDYSDDPASIGELKDELRNTTERFFVRDTRLNNNPTRRASEYPFASEPRAGDTSRATLIQQHSCNGLPSWERSVGDQLSAKSRSASCLHGAGSGESPAVLAAATVGSEGLVAADVMVDDSGEDGAAEEAPISISLEGVTAVQRGRPQQDHARLAECGCSPGVSSETAHSIRGSPWRPRPGDPKPPPGVRSPLMVLLKDLRDRSEQASRILQALKDLLMEEAAVESIGARLEAPPSEGLWPGAGPWLPFGESFGTMGPESDGRKARNSEKRMPLLLLAMDHLQQITAGVSDVLSEQRRLSGPTRSLASSGPLARKLRPRLRSSSVLLRRRRSANGQAEPISCSVPRYRIQVGRLVDDVYFEVAITQAKSMWTVERRLDEFLDLRRSLVATVKEQAEAAKRRRRSVIRHGGGSPLAEADVEARVPVLNITGSRWLETYALRVLVSRRKQKEIMAERQVHLASWLASVLADPQLMSPEFVRFLGGDGNVMAQPVVEAYIQDMMDPGSDDSVCSESEDSESDSFSGSRFASEEDDWAFNPQEMGSRSDRAASSNEDVMLGGGRRLATPGRCPSDRTPQVPSTFRRIVSLGSTGDRSSSTTIGELKGWTPDRGEGDQSPSIAGASCSPLSGSMKKVDAPSPSAPGREYSSRELSLDAFFRAPT